MNIVNKEKKSVCIVILSCDKYFDLWPGLLATFVKFWPDCPYEIFLAANYRATEFGGLVRPINYGEDNSYGRNLKTIADALPEYDYFLLWLDDWWISKRVSTMPIKFIVKMCIELGVKYCRMTDYGPLSHRPDLKFMSMAGRNSPRSPYSISMTIGLWKKSFIYEFINPDWSPWDIEIIGSKIASEEHLNNIMTPTRRGASSFCVKNVHVIIRGKVWRHCLLRSRMKFLGLIIERRGVQGVISYIKARIRDKIMKKIFDWDISIGALRKIMKKYKA